MAGIKKDRTIAYFGLRQKKIWSLARREVINKWIDRLLLTTYCFDFPTNVNLLFYCRIDQAKAGCVVTLGTSLPCRQEGVTLEPAGQD